MERNKFIFCFKKCPVGSVLKLRQPRPASKRFRRVSYVITFFDRAKIRTKEKIGRSGRKEREETCLTSMGRQKKKTLKWELVSATASSLPQHLSNEVRITSLRQRAEKPKRGCGGTKKEDSLPTFRTDRRVQQQQSICTLSCLFEIYWMGS